MAEMREHPPADGDWLALCLLTETNRPHEMPLIAWVIRNRVDTKGRFGDGYFEVITANKQFSYFNGFQPIQNTNEDIWRCGNGWMIQGSQGDWKWNTNLELVIDALNVASVVMLAERWESPFDKKVTHYWSPVSMLPRGSDPWWAHSMERVFEWPGVDPWRFKFAQEK